MEGGPAGGRAPTPEEDAAAAWASVQKTWGKLGMRLLEVYSSFPPFTLGIGKFGLVCAAILRATRAPGRYHLLGPFPG